MITEFDLGWLIGLIDGEGCFMISGSKVPWGFGINYSPRIIIVNTNLEIIGEAIRILRELNVEFCLKHLPNKGKKKPAQQISVQKLSEIKKLLDVIFSRMKCRLDQASMLKAFVELRLQKKLEVCGDEEYFYYQELQQLNHRGVW